MLEAFATSTLAVTLAETGDKTQLLSIVLASKFKRPMPIIVGILVATIANHFLAALAGASIAGLLQGIWFQLLVAISFVGMGFWTLIPDKEEEFKDTTGQSVFWTTVFCFFAAEMGDKTQVATVALAARFHDILAVCLGTTLGMMIANVPAVIFGEKITKVVPLDKVRMITAILFIIIGGWTAEEILLKMAHLYW
jgi:putative Ca2+/H+ antiporter (TMEM165/GDT1 family)